MIVDDLFESNTNRRTAVAIAKELHANLMDLIHIRQAGGNQGPGNPHNIQSLQQDSVDLHNQLEQLGFEFDFRAPDFIRPLTMYATQQIKLKEYQCMECGGPAFTDLVLAEKKDACYYKVKSRYKVWPSAYASGALVQCRKKGSKNWGKKNESSDDNFGKPAALMTASPAALKTAQDIMQKQADRNVIGQARIAGAVPAQGVAEGEKSPMFKDAQKADKIRSLKNLIAIAREQGRQLRVQELELELKKLQGVTEMDKSAPQPGRDGRVSHKTYGSRDKYKLGDPERTAKQIPAKKAKKDALDILKKQGVAESVRLIGHEQAGNRSVNFYRDSEWNEYIVQFFLDGEHQTDADYHTDDKQDALDTAKKWLKGFPKPMGPDTLNEFVPSGGNSASYYSVTADYIQSLKDQHQQDIEDMLSAGWTEKDLAASQVREQQASDLFRVGQVQQAFLKGLRQGFDTYRKVGLDTMLKDSLGCAWVNADLPVNADWKKVYGKSWGNDEICESLVNSPNQLNEGAKQDAALKILKGLGIAASKGIKAFNWALAHPFQAIALATAVKNPDVAWQAANFTWNLISSPLDTLGKTVDAGATKLASKLPGVGRWVDTEQATRDLNAVLGKSVASDFITNLAKLAVDNALPIAGVMALLYGGKVYVDYIKQQEAEQAAQQQPSAPAPGDKKPVVKYNFPVSTLPNLVKLPKPGSNPPTDTQQPKESQDSGSQANQPMRLADYLAQADALQEKLRDAVKANDRQAIQQLTQDREQLDAQARQGLVPEGKKQDDDLVGGRYTQDEFDAKLARLRQLAQAGPLRTVWDEKRRVYHNVPVNKPKDVK